MSRRVGVAVLALAAAACVAGTAQLALAAYPAPRVSSFPGGPYFVVTCSSTHRNNDDPIVFPSQPGKSHNHTFVGNRSANAFSTPGNLRDPTDARCGPRTDGSAYWFPTLYSQGNAVRPLVSIIYYVRRTASVEPFPVGLKMIAGNASATRAQSAAVASFSCGPPDRGVRTYANPPNCRDSQLLHLNVNFQDCWDGRRLDTPTHQAHMAYSTAGRCPSTHPVAVPMMRMLILYNAVRGGTLSSGRFSLHGDFINAWDEAALERLVRRMNY